MHQECYWGRVASLDDWREYLAWLKSDETLHKSAPWKKPGLCPACRAKGGA
jgi:hypothetical protein